MALALDQLVFSVDSTQLDEARIKIAKLGDAVAALNKPLQDMSRSSAKTNEVIAKSELAAEKARAATKALGDQVEDSGEQMSKTEKYLDRLSTGMKLFRGEVVSVQAGTLELGNGFTRGQANALAYQIQLGATKDQLGAISKEFKDLNAFSNTNPFDKSTRGLSALRQEIAELEMVDKFMRDGVALTRDQIVNLANDSTRLTQAFTSMKKSEQELADALQRLQKETIEQARIKNILTEAARQSEIQAKKEADALIEQSRAIKLVNDAMMKEWAASKDTKDPVLVDMAAFYRQQGAEADQLAAKVSKLNDIEKKLAFTNQELATGMTTASANALYDYRRRLEDVGTSSDVVAKKMQAFKEQLMIKQQHSPLAGIAKDAKAAREQVDHLSRAIGVQLGDVAVSLASGMNPFLVLIQQGDQLRFAVQAAREAGQDLEGAMKKALSGIVMSFIDTGKVIGGFFVNSMLQAGQAVTDLAVKILFANKTIQAHSLATAISADSGNKLASFLFRAFSKIPMLIGAAAGSVTIFAGIALAAFFSVEKQMKSLTTSLILTGGSLGLTTDSAIRMAQSMEQAGVSSSKALTVMTAMAKQGGFASREIELVTKSAVDMQKWLGVSVEDTVKQFSKLKGEPVDALIEIAKQTGLVDSATLATVISLSEQGRTAEAAAVAMKAYGDVTVAQVQRAKQEYTEFAQLMIGIGEGLGKFWDNIKSLWIKAAPSVQLTDQIDKINMRLRGGFLSDDHRKQLEDQRKVLTDQYMILEKKRLNEEQSLVLNTESAKVIESARKTTEKYLTGIPKLEAERTAEKNKQIRLEDQLNKQLISKVAYEKGIAASKIAIAKIDEDIAKENKKNGADSEKAAKKYQDELKKAINVYEDIVGISDGVTKSYNEQVTALKLLGKEGKKSPEQIAEAFGKLEEQQPRFKALVKDFEDYDKAIQAHLGVMKEYRDSNAESSAQLEFRANLLGKTAEEQRLLTIENEKSVALLKAQVKYEKELKAIVDSGVGGIDLEVRKFQLNKEYEQTRTLIAQDANLKIAEDYQKQFEAIQKELGDVMFLALTNRGAQAGKKLRDLIKAELMKPITVVINAAVNAIFGDAINSLLAMVGVKVPGAASAAGSLGSAAGLYKTGNNIYSATTGGFAKAGTAASALTERFATSALGRKLGLSSVQSVNVPVFEAGASSASGTTMVSNNAANQTVMTESGQSLTSGIGNLATSITATLVGQALRKAIAGGYKMNKGLETVADVAGIVAGFDKTGFSQIVVGVVSGLASRAFGTKLTQSGIQGTFGGEQGFTGSRYTFEKGGWLRSDRERMQPLEQELQSGLALAFNVTKFEVQKFTDYMGVGADAIANFSYKMKLNLKGLSEADALKAIDAEFAKVKESMAAAVLAGKSYGKANESSYQTLERLATTVYSVNSIFKDLGANVLAAGYAGVDTALMFSEFFGGIDKFGSSLSKFYESFYTDAERTTNLTRNTTDAFKALGLALPTSRDAFKELVKSAINAGNPQLLTSLLGLQDSFLALTEPVEDLSNAFTQLTDNLLEEVKRLRGAIISDVGLSGGIPGLTAEFAILTAQAKSGNTTALEKLPEYSQAIEQAVAASAVNASDVAYARAWLAESLGNTNAVLTGTSPSIVSSNLTQDVAGTTAVNGATALTASASSQSDLIAILVAEIQGLRAEVRADVSANTKTSKILERANQDGETLSVTIAA